MISFALTGGIIPFLKIDNESIKEKYDDIVDKVTDNIGEKVTEAIQKKIDDYEEEKQSLSAFKETLGKLAESLDKPLVFIIDELDRCRPDFAIRLIERIKHFFDIPKIVFVLVIDKTQFSKVVCHNYGYDEKLGEEYLDKFVDFTIGLNILPPQLEDHLQINICNIFKRLGIDLNETSLKGCLDLIQYYIAENNLTKRNIVKLASQFSLLYSKKFDNLKNQILIMLLVNNNFISQCSNSKDLYKILLNQLDSYIDKNKNDFEDYKKNYKSSRHSDLMVKASFFILEHEIFVFLELVDCLEQLDSDYKKLGMISIKNLRPTEDMDFLSSWKNYVFGGV